MSDKNSISDNQISTVDTKLNQDNLEFKNFLTNLHHSSKIISYGIATVLDNVVEAAEIKNLYGQHVIWGLFSVDGKKGKFVGKLAHNANTEGVVYKPNKQARGFTNCIVYYDDYAGFDWLEIKE